MKTFSGASAPVLICLTAFLACGAARAGTISAPPAFPGPSDPWGSVSWYVGCDYEYSCDSYYTTGQNLTGGQVETPLFVPTAALTATRGTGTNFAFQEVDFNNPYVNNNYFPVDYVVFDAAYTASPVTFTFGDPSNNNPIAVPGFATTLYENNPFTGSVSAYDSQGQLLGSTTFSSVEDTGEYYFGEQSYSALAGVVYTDSLNPYNIASVVVSTSDNTFAFGTTAVQDSPEPGTFVLILLATAIACAKFSPGMRNSG